MLATNCLVKESAKKQPGAVAIETDLFNFTYKELEALVTAHTERLRSAGIKKGMRVCFIARQDFRSVLHLFSILRIGAAAAPLSFRDPAQKITEKKKQLQAHYFLEEDLDTGFKAILLEEKAILTLQCATLLFTSGSSGHPKIACHSLDNHLASASSSNQVVHLQAGDRYQLSLPLFHIGGLAIVFRTFLAGATLLITQQKNYHQAASHLSLVPTQLHDLLLQNRPLPKVCLLGGAPISDALLHLAKEKGVEVYATYGMTEMCSQIATAKQSCSNELAILPNVTLKVNKDGEILVKGPSLFLGYFSNLEKATDAEGFFPTADLGQLSPEGKLRWIGRKDRLFISGGENIQPEEIELILQMHPGIEKACVVPLQDLRYGMRPALFLTGKRALTLGEIEMFLKDKLPKYKWPVALFPLPETEFKNPYKQLEMLALQ